MLGWVQERVQDALDEWEELTAPGRPPPTAADIDALARRHSLLAGKWMAFPQQVRVVWVGESLLARCQGRLRACASHRSCRSSAPLHCI